MGSTLQRAQRPAHAVGYVIHVSGIRIHAPGKFGRRPAASQPHPLSQSNHAIDGPSNSPGLATGGVALPLPSCKAQLLRMSSAATIAAKYCGSLSKSNHILMGEEAVDF
jgi:hypothetical protein